MISQWTKQSMATEHTFNAFFVFLVADNRSKHKAALTLHSAAARKLMQTKYILH